MMHNCKGTRADRRRRACLWAALALLAAFCASPLTRQAAAGASAILSLDAERPSARLAPYVEVLEDPLGSLTIDDVTDAPWSLKFRPGGPDNLNLGVSSSAFWIRFTLRQGPGTAPTPSDESWLLDPGWKSISSMLLYVPLPGGGFYSLFAGEPAAAPPGATPAPDMVFKLPRYLSSQPMTFYLRVESRTVLFLPLEVLSQSAFLAKEQGRTLWHGAYFGAMTALALFNLMMLLTFRHDSQIWYVLYVLCIMGYFLSYNGYLVSAPLHLDGQTDITVRLVFMGLFVCCAAQFARRFLITRLHSPASDRVLKALLVLSVCIITATGFVRSQHVVRYYMAFAGFAPIVAIGAGAVCLARGFRPARYYLVAWAAMGFGGLVHSLLFSGMLPLNAVTMHIFQGSTSVEAVVLTLALVDRIRILHRQRDQLLLAEDRLRGLLDAIPTPIAITRLRDNALTFINQALCQAMGAQAKDMLGKPAHGFYADPVARDAMMDMVRSEGRVQGFETRMGRPGHWEFWASVSATRVEYSGEPSLAVVLVDVTARRHAEEALRESEEKYRLLTEHTNEGVGVVQEGILTFTNGRITDLVGYKTEDVLGQPYLSLIFQDDRPMVMELLDRLLTGKSSDVQTSFRIRRADGGVIWVESHAVRAEWEGRPAVLYFLNDVTLRRRMEEALVAAKTQAEEASRAKTQFLAAMSHEIRTPMNAVLGMVDLALEGDLKGEQRHFLATAHASARHLLDVINNILDLAKIEARMLALERIDFDLREAVSQSLAPFTYQARHKGIWLKSVIAPETPHFVRGDPSRLRQILVNLLGNAVKFTERGGVTLRILPAQAPPGREGVTFRIEDTGIGIAADKLQRIFESFSQADGSITRRFGGSGLGLAISRQLVELMGGHIWVESHAGAGSAFSFTVFLDPGRQDAVRPLDSAPAGLQAGQSPGPGLRVLLVEDNPVNVQVAEQHLQRQGHQVTVAWNGRDALISLGESDFDVVLMDIEMPDMDGFETTRRIRRGFDGTGHPVRDPSVPVVAMTAHALSETRERCTEAGMDGYISKPVNHKELHRLILDVVARKSAGTEKNVESGKWPAQEPTPPATATPSGAAVLDIQAAISLLGIEQDQFPALLASAVEEIGQRLQSLRLALAAGDTKQAGLHAHTIKSSAASIGALRCRDLADALSRAAREERTADLDGLASALEAAFADVLDAVKAQGPQPQA